MVPVGDHMAEAPNDGVSIRVSQSPPESQRDLFFQFVQKKSNLCVFNV